MSLLRMSKKQLFVRVLNLVDMVSGDVHFIYCCVSDIDLHCFRGLPKH